MSTLEIRNDTLSVIELASMKGFTIGPGVTRDLYEIFTHEELCRLGELKDRITNFDLVLIKDSIDLSVSEANSELTLPTFKEIQEYTNNFVSLSTDPTPLENPSPGERWLQQSTGVEYKFDSVRELYLSEPFQVPFGTESSAGDSYLSPGYGWPDEMGYPTVYPACLVWIHCRILEGAKVKTFRVMNGATNLFEFATDSDGIYKKLDLNVHIPVDADLKVYVVGRATQPKKIGLLMGLCWRYLAS